MPRKKYPPKNGPIKKKKPIAKKEVARPGKQSTRKNGLATIQFLDAPDPDYTTPIRDVKLYFSETYLRICELLQERPETIFYELCEDLGGRTEYEYEMAMCTSYFLSKSYGENKYTVKERFQMIEDWKAFHRIFQHVQATSKTTAKSNAFKETFIKAWVKKYTKEAPSK